MAQPAREQPISHGSETILLAEDPESLLEMAREYLESVGYKVLEASSGTEAHQISKEFAGTIHLVLTDAVMPEMSGPEMARQLESLRPGVKVISRQVTQTMPSLGKASSTQISLSSRSPIAPKPSREKFARFWMRYT